MRNKSLFIFIIPILMLHYSAMSQTHTISGYVQDAETGERLIGCIVKNSSEESAVTTNTFGYFSLKTKKSPAKIQVMYLGYMTYEKEMSLKSDTSIVVDLTLNNEIEEVIITTDRQDVQSTQMSKINVSIQKMEKLPVIFGETDLMKTLQLMPGVQSGTEGSNGIYVRGGGPDQNLVLLDGVPVYNVSHMFGFFSVFNSDAIKNVSLYKGGFPARYGGRLSSVIDVQMKDGNIKKHSGSVSVGIIASKFTIEGPIKKDKTSFIISGRRTYIDLLAKPFIMAFGQNEYNDPGGYSYKNKNGGGYYFYDLNAKITHKLTPKDRLFLSFYGGQDVASIKSASEGTNDGHAFSDEVNSKLYWGNIITAARWNHSFKKNLFVNTTFTYSRFDFGLSFQNAYEDSDPDNLISENYSAGYVSGIDDLGGQVNFDYLPNANHNIKFGASGVYHTFRPGEIEFSIEQSNPEFQYDTIFGSSEVLAPEYSIYAEDDFSLGKILKFNLGGRLSLMDVRDTIFWHPELRASSRILLNDNFSIKFSYAEMMQYLHFLTNNTVGLPIDLWMPATDLIIPEESWQAAAGISWLIGGKYTLAIEGFYKEMDNLIEFKEGESIFSKPGEGGMGDVWEQKVAQGHGTSYGAEFFLEKKYGKFTGWVSYTLAQTTRNFPNINYGETFSYKYDRRHDISIVMMYEKNKNVNFGLTWVYGSGMPTTLAKSEFIGPFGPGGFSCIGETFEDGTSESQCNYRGNTYYGNRNNYRLPAYHRLDISANVSKDKKHGRRTWSFGLYNAYSHINPFYAMLVNKMNAGMGSEKLEYGKTYLKIISIFPVMPSISYKFVW